jgi:hypothetical protein
VEKWLQEAYASFLWHIFEYRIWYLLAIIIPLAGLSLWAVFRS